jgi:hypothetical protein
MEGKSSYVRGRRGRWSGDEKCDEIRWMDSLFFLRGTGDSLMPVAWRDLEFAKTTSKSVKGRRPASSSVAATHLMMVSFHPKQLQHNQRDDAFRFPPCHNST